MIAVDDGFWSGNQNFADLLFLIGALLFIAYALVGFADRVKPLLHNVLLGLGLACVAVGWLVL